MQPVSPQRRRLVAEVWHRFNVASDIVFDASYDFVDDAVDQTLSCVECGCRFKPLDRFCPTCDQAFPMRLHWKAVVLLIGVPSLLGLVLYALTM